MSPLFDMPLAPWNARSPVELYALFRIQRRRPLSDARRDQYARLLMHVISIQFNRLRWNVQLRKCGLAAPEVAQDALVHLMRKTPEFRPNAEGWKVLLAMFNTAIFRFVMGEIRERRRHSTHEVVASDYYSPGTAPHSESTEPRSPADKPAPARQPGADVSMEGLRRQLDLCEDSIIGSIVTTGAEMRVVQAAFRIQRRRLHGGHPPLAIWELPTGLRRGLSAELHALITARFIRLANHYAAG